MNEHKIQRDIQEKMFTNMAAFDQEKRIVSGLLSMFCRRPQDIDKKLSPDASPWRTQNDSSTDDVAAAAPLEIPAWKWKGVQFWWMRHWGERRTLSLFCCLLPLLLGDLGQGVVSPRTVLTNRGSASLRASTPHYLVTESQTWPGSQSPSPRVNWAQIIGSYVHKLISQLPILLKWR